MTTLYVIGNGFDLHHGMKTRYADFGAFLKSDHCELYRLLEDYFPMDDADDFWGHFEERLADFDADTLVDNSEHLIVPYGADDWSDAYHHDYAFELDQVVEALSVQLLKAFAEWIRRIGIPVPSALTVPPARIDQSARFINFNYTATLQRLYGVPESHVWHIHGAAERPTDPLVLGHGWRPAPKERRADRLDPEREDTRVLEGAAILDRYFDKTFKPTEQIIADNAARFAALADVDDIRVLGHSLSGVDLPYLKQVAAHVRPGAAWRISSRGDPSWLQEQFSLFAAPAVATYWPLPEV